MHTYDDSKLKHKRYHGVFIAAFHQTPGVQTQHNESNQSIFKIDDSTMKGYHHEQSQRSHWFYQTTDG